MGQHISLQPDIRAKYMTRFTQDAQTIPEGESRDFYIFLIEHFFEVLVLFRIYLSFPYTQETGDGIDYRDCTGRLTFSSFGYEFVDIIPILYDFYLFASIEPDAYIMEIGGATGHWAFFASIFMRSPIIVAETLHSAEDDMCINFQKYKKVFAQSIPIRLLQASQLVWEIGHPTMDEIIKQIIQNNICNFRCSNVCHYMTPEEFVNFLLFIQSVTGLLKRDVTLCIHVMSPLSTIPTEKTELELIYDQQCCESEKFPGDVIFAICGECHEGIFPTNGIYKKLLPGRVIIDKDGDSLSYPEISNLEKLLMTQSDTGAISIDFSSQLRLARMFNISLDLMTKIVIELGGNIQHGFTYAMNSKEVKNKDTSTSTFVLVSFPYVA